ncbi:MAG: helix-turn-helix transcriptional regulator [Clostridia bacterium]|nr:helix-turn-helix transcriptional regulator [Clostridia bacterium]
MENLNLVIGKKLLYLRKKNKLTQAELAEKLNYSDKAISKWEKGESLPPVEVFYNISKLYGVSLDYIIGDETIDPQPIKTDDRKRIYLNITHLAVVSVWFVALLLFVLFDIITHTSQWMVFAWAVPASFVVALVFDCVWHKRKGLFLLISLLIWSILLCFTLQFLTFNIWKILLVGIPVQIAIFICARMVKKQ